MHFDELSERYGFRQLPNLRILFLEGFFLIQDQIVQKLYKYFKKAIIDSVIYINNYVIKKFIL